jgi:hypothetical protein
MPSVRPIRILLALIALGFFVWKYAPWPTRTITFNDQNCQCQIPYNWTFKNNPHFIMEAHRPYGGTVCIEAKTTSASVHVDDPAFSQGIKNRLITDGFEVLDESRALFEGHPAYAYTMRKMINGKMIYTHSVNFIAGSVRYDLLTAKKDADPTQDSQLQKAQDSFSLINPASN